MIAAPHSCAVPGCYLSVPFNQLCCKPHWKMIPAGLQRDVWGAWRAQQAARKVWEASGKSKVTLAGLARAGQAHRWACRAAVAAVLEALP
jgi:hypothetical protein